MLDEKKKGPAGGQTKQGVSGNSTTDSIAEKPKKVKAAGKKAAADRTRNFATVVYPESAPENWRDILSEQHVAALISPLHDRDVNPDGKQKKPHYHVMVMFDGVKNFDTQVKPIFDSIGGVGREMVNSMRGYARYMCHLDNPEKAQYDPKGVTQLGGADFESIIHLPTDDYKLLVDILAYVKANQIYSLAELLDICSVNNPDWFVLVATNRAYIVDKYIKSLQWEMERGYKRVNERICDPDTGEVVENGEQSNT